MDKCYYYKTLTKIAEGFNIKIFGRIIDAEDKEITIPICGITEDMCLWGIDYKHCGGNYKNCHRVKGIDSQIKDYLERQK